MPVSFLHAALLAGLVAASLPIIIHILNRRKARIVEWGAMQFLELSLATRGRRILLEEIILLAVRTLMLIVLVGALARPLLSNQNFAAGANQDVVILLDGSMSMGMMSPGGETPGQKAVSYFELARDAAAQAVNKLAPGDAVAVLLIGSTPRGLTEGLTFDHHAAWKATTQAEVTEGAKDMPRTLALAAAMLNAGANFHKQVLVITDGRAHGWRAQSVEDWQALAGKLHDLRMMTPRVQVLNLAHNLEAGRHDVPVNLAIESVRASRPVVGTDLPVVLTVDVRNTGVAPTGDKVPLTLRMTPDAREPDHTELLEQLEPMASKSVQFSVKFDHPGPYHLVFRLEAADALAADNRFDYTLDVLPSLPVLLVRPDDPTLTRERDGSRWLKAAFRPSHVDPTDQKIEFLVAPKVIEASQLGRLSREDLDGYYAVVLTNVPKLEPGAVARLKEFVTNGGGLLVAPGDRIDVTFYNVELFDKAGLLPGTFQEPVDVVQPELAGRRFATSQSAGGDVSAPGEGASGADANATVEVLPPVISLQPPAHGHPAFIRTADPALWMPVRVFRRFPILTAPDVKWATVLRLTAGATDDEGLLYAAERQVGRGRVVMLAGPVDVQWSNLMLCDGPIAAVNELIYYLSAPRRTTLSLSPGQMLAVASTNPKAVADLRKPDGKTDRVGCVQRGDRLMFEYGPLNDPGVYELAMPAGTLALPSTGETAPVGPAAPIAPGQPAPSKVAAVDLVYFTVSRDPGESLTTLLNDDIRDPDSDASRIARWLPGVQFHHKLSDLVETVRITDPGREIWKYVAAAVLALLLAEIWLSGWITARRRGRGAVGVAFGQKVDSVGNLPARAPVSRS